jgi:hypothetical protein
VSVAVMVAGVLLLGRLFHDSRRDGQDIALD